MTDHLASHAGVRSNLSKKIPGSAVFQRLGMSRDTGGDLRIDFAIDGPFRLFLSQILHPHLGMLLSIEVVIHAHPFVEVGGEDLIKSGWQERMVGFEAC